MSRLANDPNLRLRLEKQLNELPVLPKVVSALLILNREDEDYFEKVLELVQGEPNMATRILVAANSAASAAEQPVLTLHDAITRVGSMHTSGLVLGLAITHVFKPRDAWELSLWRHGVQVAAAARELAVYSGDPELLPEEVYACGLLHDMGRFLLWLEDPEALCAIETKSEHGSDEALHEELEHWGMTHAELGALACEQWGLPPSIYGVVREHHQAGGDDCDLSAKAAKFARLVHVADLAMLPSAPPGAFGLHRSDDATLQQRVADHLPAEIDMSLLTLRQLLTGAHAEATATARALGLG